MKKVFRPATSVLLLLLVYTSLATGQENRRYISIRFSIPVYKSYTLEHDNDFANFVNPGESTDFSLKSFSGMGSVNIYFNEKIFAFGGYGREVLLSDEIDLDYIPLVTDEVLEINYDTKYFQAGIGYVAVAEGITELSLTGAIVWAESKRWTTFTDKNTTGTTLDEAARKGKGTGGRIGIDLQFNLNPQFALGLNPVYQFLEVTDFELNGVKEPNFIADFTGVKVYVYLAISF